MVPQKIGADNLDLEKLGWTFALRDFFTEHENVDLIPGRVSSVSGRRYRVMTEEGEPIATLFHSARRSVINKSDLPAVGDWVGLIKNTEINRFYIYVIHPRKNKLSRMVAGKKTEEQIIAANIDKVFIVTSLDNDFNIRRLERSLVIVYEIGAQPVIILNKVDKCDNHNTYVKIVKKSGPRVPVLAISALDGINISEIRNHINPGETIVLLGSSGVGKSTLINQLLGYERQKVGEIRESDGKGRHVTSTRELIMLPRGGMLIDNPGIREIQLWTDGHGIIKAFSDVEEFALSCHFKDCSHQLEPECAVKQAVIDGILPGERLEHFHKLQREKEHSERKRNVYERKKEDKRLGKMYRSAKNYIKIVKKRDR